MFRVHATCVSDDLFRYSRLELSRYSHLPQSTYHLASMQGKVLYPSATRCWQLVGPQHPKLRCFRFDVLPRCVCHPARTPEPTLLLRGMVEHATVLQIGRPKS